MAAISCSCSITAVVKYKKLFKENKTSAKYHIDIPKIAVLVYERQTDMTNSALHADHLYTLHDHRFLILGVSNLFGNLMYVQQQHKIRLYLSSVAKSVKK